MLQTGILALTLFNGVLVEPFRLADSEPGHHQVLLRVAMAPDGHFAVAWVDSLEAGVFDTLETYIRFFDSEGTPLTDAYCVGKTADSVYWVSEPCLEMDSAGNTLLVWADNQALSSFLLSNIRYQRFDPDGNPIIPATTLRTDVYLSVSGMKTTLGASLSNSGEFAVATREKVEDTSCPSDGPWIRLQRFDLEGAPKCNLFEAHEDVDDSFTQAITPQVALNDAGDMVVTFRCFDRPVFQVFDSTNTPIVPWEPFGNLLYDGDTSSYSTRAKPFWLDEDRFVVVWADIWVRGFDDIERFARVFSDKGLTRHPVSGIMGEDSKFWSTQNERGVFCTALSGERFVHTHTRCHDNGDYKKSWSHQWGFIGEIEDNVPVRKTGLFQYSHDWGADTIIDWVWEDKVHTQPPAVACIDERIVWVYSRFDTDSLFKAWITITDWDMGEGVVESPEVNTPILECPAICRNTLNYTINSDPHSEIDLVLYDISGRAVSRWNNLEPRGQLDLDDLSSGVYYLKVLEPTLRVQRVVVIK
ncbi:T9SS type A sorting domain-containing protein [candidate division WOR-3 bacterium]|uniref:T9SS type A sorting domain-containing protein n=1 Tax=candidate division WOR-3 bacterium TaxID=2052148 RepID=A0A9D5K7Y4_UNCW3|nr:T9SS type A sorting domain-containing protein [candidate division WOR-3 bacterium]MBD3363770.1 T9SS type A sorting domain-containing protein [candidate division WOR-3 bacterium]